MYIYSYGHKYAYMLGNGNLFSLVVVVVASGRIV